MNLPSKSIVYSHAANQHSRTGPMAAIPRIFSERLPKSVLDLGCGIGTWLKAFQNLGVGDIFGVDGVAIPDGSLLIDRSRFLVTDFTTPLDLGRRFEWAICLEVAEHLPELAAPVLIGSLCRHSDAILFSAAAPEQPGQHHVNCQWPRFWQNLFNAKGFACADDFRPRIWECQDIEPHYRQNCFRAFRSPNAGTEPRIPGMIHPDCLSGFLKSAQDRAATAIETGEYPPAKYLKMLARSVRRKLRGTDNPVRA
jgi:SAM-dependent methyltransferase